ncbi:TniQ family protein [Paenibacillus tundrae]|uniref:TniQ family protein n=1 Tax=Paenibacillus tundrae TaxID=528187 RepID=UPI0030CED78E
MEGYFRIRPKIAEHESLTSYLYRLAKCNETTYRAIIQKVKTQNFVMSTNYKYLDNDPYGLIDIHLLSKLTQMSSNELFSHTLHPIVLGTTSHSDPKELKKIVDRFAVYYYDNQKRKYCSHCLELNNIYKLIWQIKSIEICPIHRCKLNCSCSECGAKQPYLGKHLQDFKCFSCKYPLTINDDVGVLDEIYLHKMSELYHIWESLLSIITPITSAQFNLTIEQTVCLKMLFLSQSNREKYNVSNNKIFHPRIIHFLKEFIGNEGMREKSYLGSVIRFFTNSGISIKQFRDTKISREYFESFVSFHEKKYPGNCETPWCEFRNCSKKMCRIIANRKQYNGAHYCSGCFIKYGYHKKTEKWKEIGKKTALVKKIISDIYEQKNIETLKENEIIGYIHAYNLLPSSTINFQEICVPETEDLLQKFKVLLALGLRSTSDLYKEATKLFGWSMQEFVCYLNQKVVQQLLFNAPKILRGANKWSDLHLLLSRYLKDCHEQNKMCSKKEFMAQYDISKHTMLLSGINNSIEKEIELFKERTRKEKTAKLKELAQQFVTLKAIEKKPLHTIDVLEKLGVSVKWSRKNCPDLYYWVLKEVEKSREEIRQLVSESNKERLKETIEYMKGKQMAITKVQLREMLGLKINALDRGTELCNYYNELLLDMKVL